MNAIQDMWLSAQAGTTRRARRWLLPFEGFSRNDWIAVALYWCIATPLILIMYLNQASTGRAIGAMLFNIILDTFTVWVIVYILIPRFLIPGRYLLFFIVMAGWALLDGAIYNVGYEVFLAPDSIDLTLSQAAFGIVQHLQSYGFLGILILGTNMFQVQGRYLRAERERKESELRMLKAQLDPHFLFNNLNILDVLIMRDQALASAFLCELSGLYRYLLRHKDQDVVSLQDELKFSDGYVFLLQHRFDNAYKFEKSISLQEPDLKFLPPGALQTLIENVVKHNQADDQDPLHVRIIAQEEHLIIENDLRPKPIPPEDSGLGLTNLRARYALLTDRPVQVEATASSFRVTLPLLSIVKA